MGILFGKMVSLLYLCVMGKSIKVRFNLGRGKNYMKWKIQYPTGVVEYHSPTDTQLVLKGCTLKNSRITADKIFNGQHKSVCAWVLCEDVEVKLSNFTPYDIGQNPRLKYNPKLKPYWVLESLTDNNVDNTYFKEIGSVDYKLFVTKL
jgi:hypothetical protein